MQDGPIEILYEDHYMLVVRKLPGLPSQPDHTGQRDLFTCLSATRPQLRLVHRLDTPTGGVMMFAQTPRVAAQLSAQVQDHEHSVKLYLCILPAEPDVEEGLWRDYLFHDARANRTYVVSPPAEGCKARAGVKEARLRYRVLETDTLGHALVMVRLYTGRTHQIRTQFSARGWPLLGDGKYGSREKCLVSQGKSGPALWSYALSCTHPVTGKPLSFTALPEVRMHPWSAFSCLREGEALEACAARLCVADVR